MAICGWRKNGRDSKGNMASALLSFLLAALFASVFSASAFGQDANQNSSFGSQGAANPFSSAAQNQNQASAGMQSATSSEALIAYLQRHPELVAAARVQMAQAAGVDPATVTDQQLYDRLRQDPALAAKVVEALQRRGYNIVSDASAAPGLTQGAGQALASGAAPSSPLGGGQSGPCPAGYVAQSSVAPAAAAITPQSGAQSQLTSPTPMMVCMPAPAGQGNVAPAPPTPPQSNIQQRRTPYGYMTPLTDLYSQMLPPDNSALQRFGANVFVLGTGNTDALPMDLPAGPDYVLGTGDTLNVNIWGSQSATLSLIIDRQGQIALPQTGTVEISGLTIDEAQKAIQRNLATQFKDTHVELSLGRVRTVRVYVVGDVQRPGAYDVSSLSTPLNALYAAGGPTATGSMRVLRHYRGNQLVKEIDLYDFLLRGVRTSTDRLLPGDTLLIPPVGPQVTVNGMVRRPAIYELKGPQSLKETLEMAGGVLVAASLGRVNIERVEPQQRRTMLSVETPPLAQSSLVQTAKDPLDVPAFANFSMQDGDAVQVRPILPYNESVVYLDGHVYRPGKYPYHEGMTVSDLLHSNQDLMPEPADRLELIRLVGPDYHPETTLLNLQDVLHGSSPILLRPFDYLRAFSRYEVDSPTVTIAGEVIRPGEYPLSVGMKASDLVRMAGGFRRSALLDAADLASYEVQDRRKVLLETRIIALQNAMNGDASADVVLKPGEVLSIRQISGWQDIGSSVAMSGEVSYPGTYGIVPGERLSSVLKRAGGFRESAFPEGIVVERTAVRALNEKARQDMIQRIESLNLGGDAIGAPTVDAAQQQADTLQIMRAQQQEVLSALRAEPVSGRIVISIGKDISAWENSPDDVELRADDAIRIPKRNDVVAVVGQVFDQTTLTWQPGKRVSWYLQRAGGTTRMADRHNVYVLHADGSHASKRGPFNGDVLSARLRPGDSIVVPERFVGTPLWKDLLTSAIAMVTPAALIGVAVTK